MRETCFWNKINLNIYLPEMLLPEEDILQISFLTNITLFNYLISSHILQEFIFILNIRKTLPKRMDLTDDR